MKGETRRKMVIGAADLLRRRGLNATSLREVVRHTGTPRGSIRHHFPQGKRQLVEEGLGFAGQAVTGPLATLVAQDGVVAGLGVFIQGWRDILEESEFKAGCPVLAVAVEEYVGDDGYPDPAVQSDLLRIANEAFDDWQAVLADGLHKEGLSADKARRLATLIVSAAEGTIPLCRASKSTRPLDDVEGELREVVNAALDSVPR